MSADRVACVVEVEVDCGQGSSSIVLHGELRPRSGEDAERLARARAMFPDEAFAFQTQVSPGAGAASRSSGEVPRTGETILPWAGRAASPAIANPPFDFL